MAVNLQPGAIALVYSPGQTWDLDIYLLDAFDAPFAIGTRKVTAVIESNGVVLETMTSGSGLTIANNNIKLVKDVTALTVTGSTATYDPKFDNIALGQFKITLMWENAGKDQPLMIFLVDVNDNVQEREAGMSSGALGIICNISSTQVTFRLKEISDDIQNNSILPSKIATDSSNRFATDDEKEKLKKIKNRFPSELYVTDNVGNVVFHLDTTGLDSLGYRIIDPVSKSVVGTLDKAWLISNNSKLVTDIERRKLALTKSRYQKHGYFTDSQGYILFHFDDTGTDALAYRIIDPVTKAVVGTMDKNWFNTLNSKLNSIPNFNKLLIGYRKDGVYITDSNGNVISKTTSAGLQAIKFLNKAGLEIGNRKLEGKFAYSLGDSHSLAKWTDEFATQTGCGFDMSMQATVRANSTNFSDTALMLGEAKALKSYCTANNKNIDIIIVENVHYNKELTASEWIPMNYENVATWGTTYASYTDYSNNINADKASLIASTTPKLRTALRFPYNNYKETITFSGSNLTAGTAVLTINGFNFPITVTTGMTLSQAVTKLNDWGFEEYLATWSNSSTKGLTRTNTIELVYKGTSSSPAQPSISFNAGTTGMTMTGYALSNTTSFQDYYFNSLLLSEWNNGSKWVATNGTSVYPSMMGLLEYLQVNFPNTEIITYLVPNTQVSSNPTDANSFVKETFSGSGVFVPNMQAYQSDLNTIKYRNAQLAIKEISERYNIRCFDVETRSGISLANMFSGGYYLSNDVHPTEKGYRQWGATLAKLF